jgi:hypothetical protein
MNLTMDDIENQIAALQIKKKQLEEEKKAADNYKKNNIKNPISQLYYEASSLEILLELHKEYNIDYNFIIILDRLIDEEDSVFASKLLISGLVDTVFDHSLCGEFSCGHSNNSSYYKRDYINEIIKLLMKKGDIQRIRLLYDYCYKKLLLLHNTKPTSLADIDCKIVGVSDYENTRIYIITHEILKIKNNPEQHNRWNPNSWLTSNKIMNTLVVNINLTSSDDIIKFILIWLHENNNNSIFDVNHIYPIITKWIESENKVMLEYFKLFRPGGDNRKQCAGDIILTDYLNHKDKNLGSVYNSNIDFIKYLYDLTNNKLCIVSLYYAIDYLGTIEFDKFKYIYDAEVKWYENHNLINNTTEEQKIMHKRYRNHNISKILIASKKLGRDDIYKFILRRL